MIGIGGDADVNFRLFDQYVSHRPIGERSTSVDISVPLQRIERLSATISWPIFWWNAGMRPSEFCCSCFALAALATGLDYVSCSPPFQVPISKARCVAGSGKTRWCSKHLTRSGSRPWSAWLGRRRGGKPVRAPGIHRMRGGYGGKTA